MPKTYEFLRDQSVDVDNSRIEVDDSQFIAAMLNPCKIVVQLGDSHFLVKDNRGLWRKLPVGVLSLHKERGTK